MKKVCLFLVFVLLLGCFAGCHPAPVESTERSIENEDGTLSDWMKEEIEAAYKNLGFQYSWTEDSPKTLRYYGTDNGYVIFYQRLSLTSVGEIVIADKTFISNNRFLLLAYKDGELLQLKDVFEQGLISTEAITNTWNKHQEYEENS
ncbi:MAG: hypothetical protein J6A88_09040 [Oscillospiraceae bacterium]|nr:hypothetical protein [Oscillospiraceae bacterium]